MLRAAVLEKDALIAERDLMRSTVEDQTRKLTQAQEEVNAVGKARKAEIHRQKESLAANETTLQAARENSRKYQSQLTQTKDLLRVVQEARKRLQEDNFALRQELDEVLRRSITVAATERERSIQPQEDPQINILQPQHNNVYYHTSTSHPPSSPSSTPKSKNRKLLERRHQQENSPLPSVARAPLENPTASGIPRPRPTQSPYSPPSQSNTVNSVAIRNDGNRRQAHSSSITSHGQSTVSSSASASELNSRSNSTTSPGREPEMQDTDVSDFENTALELEALRREVEALKSAP